MEEQRQRELQEARRKQLEFEEARQNILRSMKGITENELGLKGIGPGGLGLKGIGASTTPPLIDSSLVDLRHLDPNKPITVDPHVVRGQERVFPVQPDPETFRNANYIEAFECLKRHDPYTAVLYFEKARQERPNDPAVRNGLYLAQDMIKAREQRILEERHRLARELAAVATAQLAAYPQRAALPAVWLQEAHRLHPQDPEIRDAASIAYGMYLEQERGERQNQQRKEREERALRKADTCLRFVFRNDYGKAIRILKEAQAISPGQHNIETTLSFLEGVEIERANARRQNEQRKREQQEREEQALKKANTCIPFVFQDNYGEAIRILKEAQAISPGQRNIENTLSFLEGLQLGRAKVIKQKEEAKKE